MAPGYMRPCILRVPVLGGEPCRILCTSMHDPETVLVTGVGLFNHLMLEEMRPSSVPLPTVKVQFEEWKVCHHNCLVLDFYRCLALSGAVR